MKRFAGLLIALVLAVTTVIGITGCEKINKQSSGIEAYKEKAVERISQYSQDKISQGSYVEAALNVISKIQTYAEEEIMKAESEDMIDIVLERSLKNLDAIVPRSENSIEFTVRPFTGLKYLPEVSKVGIVACRSELEGFFEGYETDWGGSAPLEEYDEDFFKDRSLILCVILTSSISLTNVICDVEKTGDGLTVRLASVLYGEDALDAVGVISCVIEVEKDKIGDATSVAVRKNG